MAGPIYHAIEERSKLELLRGTTHDCSLGSNMVRKGTGVKELVQWGHQ